MVSFGPPPESNVLSYPGISGNRFDPVSAGKIWAEVIKTEKDAGYVHRTLDGHGKLNLPPEWALNVRQKNDIMPNLESLDDAYYLSGWQLDKFGRSKQPDIRKFIPALSKGTKKTKKKKRRVDDLELTWSNCGTPRSALPSEPRSHRSLTTPMRKELLSQSASAPSLVVAAAPPPPATPPPGTRRQQRTAPPTPALSVAMSQTAPATFELPALRANSELSGSRGSLRRGSSRSRSPNQEIAV